MTPFYIYLPLAILAFGGIDRLRGRRVLWVANAVVAVVLYLLVWSTHLL